MKRYIVLFAILIPQLLVAQKIKVKSGDLASLEEVKTYYVTFDYSDMAVGKFDKEADYIEKQKSEAVERGDDPDAWEEEWINNREEKFEPRFFALFNDILEGKGVSATPEKGDATYEMNIHTKFTEPGFNVGVARRPALINVIITISEIANPDNKIVVTMDGVPGAGAAGYDFDASYRISEAYEKCGKEMGKLLAKKAYK
jgi:hypothetical protein